MRFVKESVIKASPKRVFAFHELPDAFERLIPPWENAKIIRKADISKVGSRAIIEQKILWIFTSRWVAEHTAYDPPRMFEDTMISGPFRSWRHRHIIEPHPDGAILRDEIEYEIPIPIFGPMAAPLAVTPKIEKMFEYRHNVTKEWCESSSESESSSWSLERFSRLSQLPNSLNPTNSINPVTMIIHIVCWKYKPETSPQQRAEHIAKLRALPDVIPNIESFNVGADILHLERSFDTGLVSVYPNMAALDAYTDHPEHQKVAELGRELAEKVVSVDFESGRSESTL